MAPTGTGTRGDPPWRVRRAQCRTRARVFRGAKMAHRHALPEPLGLSAQSQVPHGTRRDEGGGAGFTARKRVFPPAQPWVPGQYFPMMGLCSLCPMCAARTPTLEPESRKLSRLRGARASRRAQPPQNLTRTARGARGRARMHPCARCGWLGFSTCRKTQFLRLRGSKREKFARAHAN